MIRPGRGGVSTAAAGRICCGVALPGDAAMSAARRLAVVIVLACAVAARADGLPAVPDVDGQPLGANVERLVKALDFLGRPLPADRVLALTAAAAARDAGKLQELLDP